MSSGRHSPRRPKRRRAADHPATWTAAALLWAWIAYRTAVLELPELVVAFTALTAGLAFAAGLLTRK